MIKFISSFFHSEISFLDVNVLLINGRLETTDISTLILKPSLTPNNQFLSAWPYALEEFVLEMSSLTHDPTHSQHIESREDIHTVLFREEIEKVRHIPRSKALETSMKNQSKRIPFVVTFNPALPDIRRIIFNNLNILRFTAIVQSSTSFSSSHIISADTAIYVTY